MVCKECLKYKMHKDKCWFYWKEKRACSRFEDGMGERFRDTALDMEFLIHSLLDEHHNNHR